MMNVLPSGFRRRKRDGRAAYNSALTALRF